MNSRIWLRKNDTCIIKDSQYPIRGLKIGSLSEESKIYIGQNFSCAEAKIDIKERKTVEIGDDCMFSTGINILTSDMHAIFNESGVCINPGDGVTIGNHVWVGKNAMILKGVCIPENSIVGASAVVTKPFYEPGSVIVGNPAKAVKVGFNWDRKSPETFL